MRGSRRCRPTGPAERSAGLTLAELLVAVALLGIAVALLVPSGREAVAREQVEAATRALLEGLQRGRAAAERSAAACGLSLTEQGWAEPQDGGLPACGGATVALRPPLGPGGLTWRHNLPDTVRFSGSGLVLDGGTVVVEAPGTTLRRCVVLALPLGVTRVGRMEESGEALTASLCQPEGQP
ncbi:MAG: GspH/FimT family pseudopilin [Synechococcaceae cyanobacterium]|nr:GspH/FimT family pseudopilin [Synechococcaceae cyanobacterium]